MPITYTVTTARDCDISIDGDGNELKLSYNRDYLVKVAGHTDNTEIEPSLVLTATGIPIVNRTTYTTVDGDIIPYLVCRGKRARPDKSNHSQWIVSTKWDTGKRSDIAESGVEPQTPPATLTEIAPRVEQTLGEVQQVLYIDKSTPKKAILTPTKNFYAQPAVQRIPTLMLRITQFEASVTYEQMLARKFKVNKSSYRSKGRFFWLIEDVDKTTVDVTLSGGVQQAELVTYDVHYSPFLYGWKDDRALIDTHYYDDSGSKKAFTDDELRTSSVGFVKEDGKQKAGVLPDREQFETYDEIDFSTFLQV